jgi:hypothetical protein
MSCPLTASGPVPTTLSQKARPEGATVSSHGAASAAAMASGCKRTSREAESKRFSSPEESWVHILLEERSRRAEELGSLKETKTG